MARRKSISDILAQADRIITSGGGWNKQKRISQGREAKYV